MKPTAFLLLIVWQVKFNAAQLTSFTEVFRQLYLNFLGALPGIIKGALVFLVFLVIAAIGKRIIARLAPRARADTGVVLLLSRVFYYGILTFGILTALPATGLEVGALVAGLGLTGFAIGFALKDVLSNLLAGIMLLVYRPFHIGDHIKMGEHEGTITTIRMRDTVLHAADGRSIIIPNTKLITEVVINNATAQLRRDTVALRLADEQDIGKARTLILDALGATTEHIRRVEPQITITQDATGDGAAVLEAGYWYDPHRITQADARERVSINLKTCLTTNRISAAFVTTVAMLKQASAANSNATETADGEDKSPSGL